MALRRDSGAAAIATLSGLLCAACGPGDPPPVNCATETRADIYVAGLEKAGANGTIKVRLLQSDPAPPAKGDNAWTLAVVDSGDTMIEGATLTTTPYMPDHAHGTSIKAKTTAQGMGNYLVSPVNLFMSSLWEVTVQVMTATGLNDRAVFSICIEG